MRSRHGGSRMRRRMARLCVAGAVVALALAGFGSAAAQEEGPPLPDVFSASASAQGVTAFLDRDALIPVPDAFRFVALDGIGTYESSNQTARASVFFPGNGLIAGPSLACGTFGAQFPPEFKPILDACLGYDYPLSVNADSLEPDDSTTGSVQLGSSTDPLSAKAVRAVAHAGIDASTSDAAISDLRVVGLPVFGPVTVPLPIPDAPELDPTIVTVDNAVATTDQRIDETGRLVVESVSVLDGVRLVGGLVEIGSIRSTSTVTDDGKGGKEQASDLLVTGVTVGGVPAQITEKGLVVGSPTGADGPLRDQLAKLVNQLVSGLGMKVTALPTEQGVQDSGVAFARAGGVLVEFDVDVRGLPILPGPQGDVDPNGIYTGVILLGQTGATGLASQIEDAPFTPGDVSGGGASFGAGGGALDTGFGSSSAPAAGFDDVTNADGGSEEAAAPQAPAVPGQRVVSVSELLAAGRIELVYLAFTLMAFAVCLGPRFVLPARLPGSAP